MEAAGMTAYEDQLRRHGIEPGTPGYLAGSGGPAPKRKPLDLGPQPEAKPGELYVQVYEPERDEFGRVRFFLYWHDPGLPERGPAGGPSPGTTRGQVFYADERQSIAAALELGWRVFRWPSGEEVRAA
jgi:hypothetical protein